MQKSFITALTLLAVGMVLLGTIEAQQTPPAKTSPASTAKSPASTTKAHPATTAKTATPLTLKTQTEKFSYALGMNLGTNLHKQSVPVDPSILARGLKDGLTGGKTLLTPEEASAALKAESDELHKQQQEKQQVAGEANKKEGDAFLAANKAKEGVVALPSGLQYKILTPGTGPKPTAGDTVVCNYRGTLIDGKEFDSSYKRGQPATFPVGGVIKGWVEALQLMPVGSKWQLFVPSDLAYADHGAGPDIGPYATLIFEVELLSIQPKAESKLPSAPEAAPKPEATQTPDSAPKPDATPKPEAPPK
jgi:FKBP-type peptidyl-prolyl cis-trans isomerase FklB